MNGGSTYHWLCETFDLIRDDIVGGRADDGDIDQALKLVEPFRWDTREEIREMAIAIDAMLSNEKISRVETRLAEALESAAGISKESSTAIAAEVDQGLEEAREEYHERCAANRSWLAKLVALLMAIKGGLS